MKNIQRGFIALKYQEKLPRKLKKFIIGKRIGAGTLSRLLNSVVLGEPRKTLYDDIEIYLYTFCPKCGCRACSGGGNLAQYPEHWEYFKCLRCNNVVGYIDNSPFIHALECKENNYNPVF